MTRCTRTALIAVATALVLGGLSIPSAAGNGLAACPRYRPSVPDSRSQIAKEAPKLPVVTVTDKATAEEPVTIEFEQGISAWYYAYARRGPIVDDTHYFNVQVDTKKDQVGLHARVEWPLLAEEIDLYMYGESGSMVAWSEGANQLPEAVNQRLGLNGGFGFEYIDGYPSARCTGATLEVMGMLTTPQTVTVELWLGAVNWST